MCPPLFIPKGFFNNKIKIRYGYDNYKEGWVNINPTKEKYSFRDNLNGTDLKIGLENIPLFWKKRIKKIDKNKNINQEEIDNASRRRKHFLKNPFPRKSKLFYVYYRTKINFFTSLHKISFVRKPIKNLLKNSKRLNTFYTRLIQIKEFH